MERDLYLDILRRYWWLVLAAPLLTVLIATAAALGRPPRYGATARLLITRDPGSPGAAGRTAAGEDTTAQDLPAILSGAAFRHDLAAELARRGEPIGEAELASAISATTSEHAVAVTVARGQPEQATEIVQVLIEVLRAGGMRYWGDTAATPPHAMPPNTTSP